MKAFVIKTTKSMALVVVSKNEFDASGTMGYIKNPHSWQKGETHEIPAISGTTTMSIRDKETGERRLMTTKDGQPLSFLVFA